MKQKEKGEQRENRPKCLTKKLRMNLQETEESPAVDEAGGKETKSH